MRRKSGSSKCLEESADSVLVLKRHRRKEIRNQGRIVPTLTGSREHKGGANPPLIAFGTTTSTDGRSSPTMPSSPNPVKQRTLEKLIRKTSQSSICSRRDFLARASALLESGRGLRTPEGRSFSRFAGLLNITGLVYCCLRMSKAYSLTKGIVRLPPSFPAWTTWGMMSNGSALTARASSPRIGNVSSLSGILETEVSEKYFLSSKVVERLMSYRDNSARRLQQDTESRNQGEIILLKVNS